MGTSFSLSKSTTSAALDISEWALLFFGLVLVLGIFGEYKKLPKRLLLWWPATVFELLVMIGVAGELLGDGGVFFFSRHLQTISDGEVAALNKEAGTARKEAGVAIEHASANEKESLVLRKDLTEAKAVLASKQTELEKEQQKTAGAQKDATGALLEEEKVSAVRSWQRTVTRPERLSALKIFPNTKVTLLYKPDDGESYMLGWQLAIWLGAGQAGRNNGAGWMVSGPIPWSQSKLQEQLPSMPLGPRGPYFADNAPFDVRTGTSPVGLAVLSKLDANGLLSLRPVVYDLLMALAFSGICPSNSCVAPSPGVSGNWYPDDSITIVVGQKP